MNAEDAEHYREIMETEDAYYRAKFDEHGEVRDGWDYHQWTLDRVADIPKFGSRNCRTALRH